MQPYSSTDTATARKKSRFISSERSDFHIIDYLSPAVHDTDFFDIVAWVLQGYTLATYVFIICRDLIKENDFTFKKKQEADRITAETLNDTDNADDLALLANTTAEAESKFQLHYMEHAARGIGLFVNVDKTEFMCFKQEAVSTFRGNPLKLVNQFTYLGSKISSIESDVNIHIACTRVDYFDFWRLTFLILLFFQFRQFVYS